MAFWDADFTTRAGSETATSQASLACFILAGFRVFGMVVFGGLAGLDTLEGQIVVAVSGVETLVAVIAGIRFRAGKGTVWGSITVALLALGIVISLVSFAFAGIVISAVFLAIIFQGVRGAMALGRGTGFEDDEVTVFE